MIIRYEEDLFLFDKWFRYLVSLHEIPFPFKVETHVRIKNIECDLVISSNKGTIEVELKESDFSKVFEQGIKRLELFDYVYIALNIPTYSILSVLRSYPWVIERGLGIISIYDGVVVLKAHKRKEPKQTFKNLLSYIR